MPDSLGRMTAAELQAGGYGNDPGYQNFLNWYAAGGKHGTLGGQVLNEAAVSSKLMPWGENIHYDAAGNPVSLYRAARAGEVSPYGAAGTGPSAPSKEEAAARAAALYAGQAQAQNQSQAMSLGATALQKMQQLASQGALKSYAQSSPAPAQNQLSQFNIEELRKLASRAAQQRGILRSNFAPA